MPETGAGGYLSAGGCSLTLLVLGAIAQLGERLLCKQEVTGSIPVGSMTRTQREPRSRPI